MDQLYQSDDFHSLTRRVIYLFMAVPLVALLIFHLPLIKRSLTVTDAIIEFVLYLYFRIRKLISFVIAFFFISWLYHLRIAFAHSTAKLSDVNTPASTVSLFQARRWREHRNVYLFGLLVAIWCMIWLVAPLSRKLHDLRKREQFEKNFELPVEGEILDENVDDEKEEEQIGELSDSDN